MSNFFNSMGNLFSSNNRNNIITPERQLDIDNSLFTSVANGELSTIISILRNNHPFANLNIKNQLGETLLHYACRNHTRHVNIVLFLIQEGLDINAKDNKGRTPLHDACDNYKVRFPLNSAILLVLYGADIDAEDNDIHSVTYNRTMTNMRTGIHILGKLFFASENRDINDHDEKVIDMYTQITSNVENDRIQYHYPIPSNRREVTPVSAYDNMEGSMGINSRNNQLQTQSQSSNQNRDIFNNYEGPDRILEKLILNDSNGNRQRKQNLENIRSKDLPEPSVWSSEEIKEKSMIDIKKEGIDVMNPLNEGKIQIQQFIEESQGDGEQPVIIKLNDNQYYLFTFETLAHMKFPYNQIIYPCYQSNNTYRIVSHYFVNSERIEIPIPYGKQLNHPNINTQEPLISFMQLINLKYSVPYNTLMKVVDLYNNEPIYICILDDRPEDKKYVPTVSKLPFSAGVSELHCNVGNNSAEHIYNVYPGIPIISGGKKHRKKTKTNKPKRTIKKNKKSKTHKKK